MSLFQCKSKYILLKCLTMDFGMEFKVFQIGEIFEELNQPAHLVPSGFITLLDRSRGLMIPCPAGSAERLTEADAKHLLRIKCLKKRYRAFKEGSRFEHPPKAGSKVFVSINNKEFSGVVRAAPQASVLHFEPMVEIEIQKHITQVEPFITPGQDSIWGLPSGNAVLKTSLDKLRPCDETTDEVPRYCIRFCYQVAIIEESDNFPPRIEVQSRGKHGLMTIQEMKKEFELKLKEFKHHCEFVKRQRVPELETALVEERHAHEETKERLKESNEKNNRLDIILASTQKALEEKGREVIEIEQVLAAFEKKLSEEQKGKEQAEKINRLDIILASTQKSLEEKEKEVIEIKQVLAAFEKKLSEEQIAKEQAEKKLQSCEAKNTELETSLASTQKLLKGQQEPQNECDWILNREEIHLTEEKLGSGCSGTVYKGMFRGTQVAVKQAKVDSIITDYNREKFRKEMKMAAKCRHPCMLQFIGATGDDQSPLLVTELLDTSLKAILHNRALDPIEIKTIAFDVAKGLNYLHLNQPHPIVHRDISSGNVLLWQYGQSWQAKISDYGSAVLINYARTGSGGAIAYRAPEVDSQRYLTKTDVYSYGVLLLEMCLRKEPSSWDDREELICSLEDYGWRSLIRRCLQLDPKQRPSMEDILSALTTNSEQ